MTQPGPKDGPANPPPAEQRALWAAIWAAPGDDTPRLVYADWLEEHGDPDRAEFIRVQCELARLPPVTRPRDPVRRELAARGRALLRANRRRWAGPVAQFLYPGDPRVAAYLVSESVFRRGFYCLDWDDWPAVSRVVAAAPGCEPVGDIRFTSGTHTDQAQHVPKLARWRYAGFVTGICAHGADDRHARAVARSHRLTALAHLRLSEGEVSDAGAEALAASPRCAALTELSLYGNRIGPAGAAALADSPHLGGLRRLDLHRNPLGRSGRRRLRDRFGDRVVL